MRTIRACVTSPLDANPRVTDGADGRPHYEIDDAPRAIQEFVRIFDRVAFNRSYHFVTEEEECIQRLKNNESDISTAFMPIEKLSDYYHIPVPLYFSTTSMLTGYDIKNVKVTRDADSMTNFRLLEWPVYFAVLLLVMLIVAVVVAKTIIYHRHRKIICKSPPATVSFLRHQMMASVFKRRPLSTKIRVNVYHLLFTHSGKSFKWLRFILVVLYFYVHNSFNAVFTTKQMALEEPFIVKTYQDLLKTKGALPIFYDSVSKVSDQFQSAPSNSLRRRIWDKLMKSGKSMQEYVPDTSMMAKNPRQVALEVMDKFDRNRDVLFASSLMTNTLLTFDCGSTVEDQLMRLVIFTDPSENEILLGWAIADHYTDSNKFIPKIRMVVESGIVGFILKTTTNAYEFASKLSDSSSKHITKQKNICSEHYKPPLDEEVEALTYLYLKVFFYVFAYVLIIGLIINASERAKNARCFSRRTRARPR